MSSSTIRTIKDFQRSLADSPVPSAAQSDDFFQSILGRTLRVHILDGRLFVGQFKCTDNECNIILALTHEHHRPSEQAAASWDQPKSRYVGMVVVPGNQIVKIEQEQFHYPGGII